MVTRRAGKKGGSPRGFFPRASFLNSSHYQLPTSYRGNKEFCKNITLRVCQRRKLSKISVFQLAVPKRRRGRQRLIAQERHPACLHRKPPGREYQAFEGSLRLGDCWYLPQTPSQRADLLPEGGTPPEKARPALNYP